MNQARRLSIRWLFGLLFISLWLLSFPSLARNIKSGTININTANLYQLTLLPGVGKKTAQKIIDSRKKQGNFTQINELKSRKLITNRYYSKLTPLIAVSGNHDYIDPNQQHKQNSSKKKKTHSKSKYNNYTINNDSVIETVDKVQLLTDKTYLKKLRQTISDAKQSIWIATFAFKATRSRNNAVNKLIALLIDKVKQGVKISFVLEQSNYHKALSQENHRLGKYLTQNGITVYYDSLTNTMHSKVAVIDQQFVFIGSHNMTHSALSYNHETSIMVKSKSLAKQTITYLKKISQEK